VLAPSVVDVNPAHPSEDMHAVLTVGGSSTVTELVGSRSRVR